AWSLEGEDIDVENRSGLHVLDLPAPLPPGDTVRVGFAYTGTYPDGFSKRGGGNEQFVLPSGTVLHTLRNDFLPIPGFVNSIGRPEDYEAPVDSSAQTAPPVLYTTEITVEAPSLYTVNALGDKVEETVSDGQRTAVWRSDVPVGAINVLAGQWAVAERDGVAVYYHPEHGANVGRMLDALSGAREHYAEWFGPYPWVDLRLSEFPNEVTLAQGFATNISFSEGLGFLAGRTDVADPAFSVTAHEAAHQWWGNLISAAETPGADVLLESMAQYATLRLHETVRGDESRRQFARLMEASYAERRRTNEAPLAESGDVFTVLFDKGPWVLWMMDQHLGREAMSAGLRRFADTYAIHTAERRPTLDDFLVTMRGVASDSAGFEVFLDTWFDQVVLPEYTLSDFEVTEGPDGWQVTVEAENIGTGAVPVEIAVEADGETASTVHTLHPGQPETLTWTVPFEPARVVVDPGVHVLQRNRQRAMSR
ncbi:MAG: M1 family aminopeptidase, partial [Bacteroidota bacterium]